MLPCPPFCLPKARRAELESICRPLGCGDGGGGAVLHRRDARGGEQGQNQHQKPRLLHLAELEAFPQIPRLQGEKRSRFKGQERTAEGLQHPGGSEGPQLPPPPAPPLPWVRRPPPPAAPKPGRCRMGTPGSQLKDLLLTSDPNSPSFSFKPPPSSHPLHRGLPGPPVHPPPP